MTEQRVVTCTVPQSDTKGKVRGGQRLIKRSGKRTKRQGEYMIQGIYVDDRSMAMNPVVAGSDVGAKGDIPK